MSENVKIHGVLATPRVSRNGFLYLPNELERAVKKLGDKTIPIYLEHVEADKSVGTAKLIWNPEKLQVEYEGEIFDEEIEKKIRAGAIKHVSLGADYEVIDFIDNVEIPRGLEFVELSLVAVPGIPEANLEVLESAEKNYSIDGDIILHEKVSGDIDFPVADKDRAWDADAAVGRIRKWASSDGSGEKDKIDWAKYRRGFFYYDEKDPENFGSYKLPFIDIIDGRPYIIPSAVIAVAAVLQGARGGVDIPNDEQEAIKKKVATLYHKIFDMEPPWAREDLAKNIIDDKYNMMSKVEELPNPEVQEKKPDEKPLIIEKKEEVSEKLDEKARLGEILRKLREAISGVDYGFKWSRDVITLPPETVAQLRKYVDFVELPRGADRAKWYKLSAITFGALTEGSAPSEASQSVTTVSAVPAEYGAKQVISYNQLESATVDLIAAMEDAFLKGALAREDKLIISAVDSADVTNVVYGGGQSAEANITSSDTITLNLIVDAIKKIQDGKIAFAPGDLVLVVHPKQYADLLKSSAIQKAMEFGGPEAIRRGEIPELLGCKVIVSTNVATGTGSGSPPVTTYHAVLFKAGAVGFATTRELLIEQFRAVDKRQLELTASIRSAAKVKVPEACCKIITA